MSVQQRRDDGVATPIEMMAVLVFAIAAVALLGFVGRLHAAGVQVTAASQAAARAASQQGDSRSAERAAQDVLDSSALVSRCASGPVGELTWVPSAAGTWQGGSVTVTVRCRVDNGALAGAWLPGARTITMADTQPVDRYQR